MDRSRALGHLETEEAFALIDDRPSRFHKLREMAVDLKHGV
jgi:hypothetical protein